MFDNDLRSAHTWTGAMFVQAVAEFSRMTPDRREWTEEAQAKNPPRLIRYRRLRALARAFDVQPGFETLLDGSFLRHRSPQSLEAVNNAILMDVRQAFPHLLIGERLGFFPLAPERAPRIYDFFSRHLVLAYALLASNRGVLESAGVFTYAILKTHAVNAEVEKLLRPIEEVVSLFISGNGSSRTVDELRAVGWPEEDLRRADFEDNF